MDRLGSGWYNFQIFAVWLPSIRELFEAYKMGYKLCCRMFLDVICIILILLDSIIGWYRFYRLIEQSADIYSKHGYRLCENVKLYPLLFGTFQIFGTVLGCVQIWLLVRRMHEDKSECERCFRQAFATVVASYILSAIPSDIISIFIQYECICSKFSAHGFRTETTDFIKAGLSGGSVVLFQFLLQITELGTKVKRVCDLCCKVSVPKEKYRHPLYMWTNLFLFFSYLVVFDIEMAYLLCEKKVIL